MAKNLCNDIRYTQPMINLFPSCRSIHLIRDAIRLACSRYLFFVSMVYTLHASCLGDVSCLLLCFSISSCLGDVCCFACMDSHLILPCHIEWNYLSEASIVL
eukprot:244289_1